MLRPLLEDGGAVGVLGDVFFINALEGWGQWPDTSLPAGIASQVAVLCMRAQVDASIRRGVALKP